MALRAKRTTAGTTDAPQEQAGNAPVQESVQEQTQQQAPQQQQAPTQRQANTPAVSQSNVPASRTAVQDLNAGILDNIEDMTGGGNFVTIDGSEFLFKASNETAKEIDAVITYGKRFYQWFDEDNNQYHNSDTKLDDRYRLKFDIKWEELGEDDMPVEYTLSLPTASAMSFINYVQALAKAGHGVGNVVTRMTISRQIRNGTTDRYSRVEFQMVEGEQA